MRWSALPSYALGTPWHIARDSARGDWAGKMAWLGFAQDRRILEASSPMARPIHRMFVAGVPCRDGGDRNASRPPPQGLALGIAVSGTGLTRGSVRASPASINFGSITLGKGAMQTLTSDGLRRHQRHPRPGRLLGRTFLDQRYHRARDPCARYQRHLLRPLSSEIGGRRFG